MAHEAEIRGEWDKELEGELAGLRARLPEVAGVCAAAPDGLLLAADAPGLPTEGLAALAATALAVGARLADCAGQQAVRELLVRTDTGCVALYPAGESAVLAVLAGPPADAGLLDLESRRCCARVAALFGRVQGVDHPECRA